MRTHHRQAYIADGEQSAEIDVAIAPLVLALWRAGCQTMQSCQRHGPSGKVWVGFATASDAELFLNIALSHPKLARAESWYFGQYERAARALPGSLCRAMHPEGWEFHVTFNDDSFAASGGETPGAVPDVRLEIAVLFPRRDLKWATEAVSAFNNTPRSD